MDEAIAEDRKRRHHGRGVKPYVPRGFTRTHQVTATEWRVLVANAEYPSQVKAAAALDMNIQTFKNHMTTAKRRNQASSQLDLYLRLGWLALPEHPGSAEGTIPDTFLIHGHTVVHVAACSCQK